MASIGRDPGGKKRILFVALDGSRKTIRLGKMTEKSANEIQGRVERLISAVESNTAIDADTAAWVNGISPKLRKKLWKVGLIDKPVEVAQSEEDKQYSTLGRFLDYYLTFRKDVKRGTVLNYRQARTCLIDFFGYDKPLSEITQGDADEFRASIRSKLSENTVRRHCGRAKQFFRLAVRKKIIRENPFGDMKNCTVTANEQRFYFVTREEAEKVLAACPDAQWRLIFALARFGGLRTPSETLSLKWGHVDWEHNRITIPSPKTEHCPGRESRVIPIFPELRQHLDEAFEQAERGVDWIITRYRLRNANLRTQFERIITKAGLKSWPKPFQNCRSTRETELAAVHPAHVACAWIGNTESVARKHYLRVQESDFQQALKSGTKSGTVLARNPAQQLSARFGKESQEKQKAPENQGILPIVANFCDTVQNFTVPRTGFEPVTPGLGNQCSIL
jgi:integrase